jgi:hypothetical protein
MSRMSRIDPIRRSDPPRRPARTAPEHAPEPESGDIEGAGGVRLPVPVERVSRVAPPRARPDDQTGFAAQMLGQEGQKRGLRAGAELIDRARSSYNRTEWSGARDRRAPKGARARTEV